MLNKLVEHSPSSRTCFSTKKKKSTENNTRKIKIVFMVPLKLNLLSSTIEYDYYIEIYITKKTVFELVYK